MVRTFSMKNLHGQGSTLKCAKVAYVLVVILFQNLIHHEFRGPFGFTLEIYSVSSRLLKLSWQKSA